MENEQYDGLMRLYLNFVLRLERFTRKINNGNKKNPNKLKAEQTESSSFKAKYYLLNCYSPFRLHEPLVGTILSLSTFTSSS